MTFQGKATRLKSAMHRKTPDNKFLNSSLMSDSGFDENYEVDEILETFRRRQKEVANSVAGANTVRFSEPENQSERESVSQCNKNHCDYRSDSSLYYQGVRDLVQTRLADARFDAVENKLDRVLTGIGGESKSQDLLMQLMMERMKELEQKIEKQGSLPPVSPATQAANRNKTSQQAWQDETPIFCRTSNYVVEKATQTPGKEHEAEGVYVLVSKKNDQPVRKVHHQITYAQPEFVEDSPNPKSRNVYVYLEENGTARKIRQPPTPMSAPVLVQKARTRKPLKLAQAYTGYPEYIMNKAPPPVTVRKMRKKVTTAYEGYPEYICQETRVRIPIWDSAKVNKEVMFLPPIPDPYSKRRPRDAGTPSRHMFTGNKNR